MLAYVTDGVGKFEYVTQLRETYSLLMDKSAVSPRRLEEPLADTQRRRLRLLDRTRCTRLRIAPWTAWPMPATTSTGVPSARAHGLDARPCQSN